MGAGASHGYSASLSEWDRPPLTKSIFPSALKSGILRDPHFKPLLDNLKDYLNIDSISHPLNLRYDAEKYFKHVYEEFNKYGIFNSGGRRDKYDYQQILSLSYYMIYELFRRYTVSYNSGSDNYYKELANHIDSDTDFVISLNYDMVFESATIDANKKFSHPNIIDNDGIKVIKPHGSINWMKTGISGAATPSEKRGTQSEVQDFLNNISMFYSNSIGLSLRHINNIKNDHLSNYSYRDLAIGQSATYKPILLPPLSEGKNTNESAIYDALWELSESLLKDISELVIIGTKLRDDDGRLWKTLKQSVPEETEIKIYTGSQSDDVAKKLENRLSNCNVKSYNSYFGSYIDHI